MDEESFSTISMIEQAKKAIEEHFGTEAVVRIEEQGIQPILVLHPNDLVNICFFLRDTVGFYFDFLSNITAVDHYPENRFSVVYH